MHRAYVTPAWIDAYNVCNTEPVPQDVATRFFSVVRIKSAEVVAVFDGNGRSVQGRLDTKSRSFVDGELLTAPLPKSSVTIWQAAVDEAKLTQCISRGCEFGVDHFVIFDGELSEKFCLAKCMKKAERFMRIAQDAARQCGRHYVPTMSFLPSLADVVAHSSDPTSLMIMGDPTSTQHLVQVISRRESPLQKLIVAIGAEGGLSAKEKESLQRAGFLGVRWAPYVLRSELACLAAVSIFHAFTEGGL